MKIGVISDTHIPISSKDIPDKILEEFKNVDMIIHAGDLVDLSVLDKLHSVCKDIRAVRGNMDSKDVRAKLPEKELIAVGNFKIGVMHGWGPPDKLMEMMSRAFKSDKVNLIIFGHSHRALKLKKDNILYFNPGSPTDNIFAPYNSFGIIEIDDKIEARIVKL
jgi:hypothetical protein